MREIKFRAWDNQEKRYCDYNIEGKYEKTKITFRPFTQDSWYFKGDRFIIEQFTGLLDKNGKEIYEGDRVDYIYGTNIGNDVSINNQIVDMYGYYDMLAMNHSNELEVIGTIHDKGSDE